jgi:hypothetical protein
VSSRLLAQPARSPSGTGRASLEPATVVTPTSNPVDPRPPGPRQSHWAICPRSAPPTRQSGQDKIEYLQLSIGLKRGLPILKPQLCSRTATPLELVTATSVLASPLKSVTTSPALTPSTSVWNGPANVPLPSLKSRETGRKDCCLRPDRGWRRRRSPLYLCRPHAYAPPHVAPTSGAGDSRGNCLDDPTRPGVSLMMDRSSAFRVSASQTRRPR